MEVKPKHYLVVSNNQKIMVLEIFQNIFTALCVDKLTSIGRSLDDAVEHICSRQSHFEKLFEMLEFFTDKFFCVENSNAMSDDDFYIDDATYRYLLVQFLEVYSKADSFFEFANSENSGRADAAPALKLASRKLH